MRVLYLTESVTTHDQRFISALEGAGHAVLVGSLDEARDMALSPWIPRVDVRSDDGLRTAARECDVVHAGPLHTAAALAARLELAPLVGVSWARDVLMEAPADSAAREAVSSALAKVALLIVDSLTVESAARSLGYGGPISRFPWGVDIDLFRPRATSHSLNDPVIVCSRAWEPLYRVPLVVRAFARTTTNAQLVLLNDGSLRVKINDLIDELGVRDRTIIAGHVGEHEIAKILAGARAYVSASTVDGSSISMLQALATGLPIVASDIPGNAEWLSGLPGARLIDGEDTGAWAAAMTWSLDLNPDTRQTVREAHRALAVANANWSLNQQTLVRAYESVASLRLADT